MAGSTEICNLVVVGRKSSNLALLVNGLSGIQLVSAEETRQKGCVIKKKTEHAPGVQAGPNQPDVQVKACIFSGLGTDDNQSSEMIRQSCPRDRVGVLLYCITVEGLGIKTAEMREEIKKITSAYGVDIWKISVIVFLKAHRCARALQQSGSEGESFNRAIELWKEQVQSIMLSGSMIPRRTTRKLVFAVAGKENELALPGRDFWLSVVWVQVFERGTKTCYKKGMSQLAKFQTRTKQRDDMRKFEVSDVIKGKKIWEQPISTGEMSLAQKIAIGAGGTAAGIAAGGVGATIGAVIGALAIGIPTFGIAAGAGLVIGAAVGGGIGVGAAGGVTTIIKVAKNAQEKEEQKEFCKQQATARAEEDSSDSDA